jgi:hypothetical protein
LDGADLGIAVPDRARPLGAVSGEQGRRHKKLTDWGRQLVLQARRWLPDRPLILVADSGFAALELLAALARRRVTCVTRLRLDAALYGPPPPRRPGAVGRPRTRGPRLPNLSEVLANKTTRWQRVSVPGWYGEGDRVVEICSGTATWRHAGKPIVPVRWVLLRDPCKRFDPHPALHRHGAAAVADRPLVRPEVAAGSSLSANDKSGRARSQGW